MILTTATIVYLYKQRGFAFRSTWVVLFLLLSLIITTAQEDDRQPLYGYDGSCSSDTVQVNLVMRVKGSPVFMRGYIVTGHARFLGRRMPGVNYQPLYFEICLLDSVGREFKSCDDVWTAEQYHKMPRFPRVCRHPFAIPRKYPMNKVKVEKCEDCGRFFINDKEIKHSWL